MGSAFILFTVEANSYCHCFERNLTSLLYQLYYVLSFADFKYT